MLGSRGIPPGREIIDSQPEASSWIENFSNLRLFFKSNNINLENQFKFLFLKTLQ